MPFITAAQASSISNEPRNTTTEQIYLEALIKDAAGRGLLKVFTDRGVSAEMVEILTINGFVAHDASGAQGDSWEISWGA